ncbi:MAG: flagellar hook-associated protein FlgK [Deltaproteobacteria bacterium]|nr:flagellar hook-associated protein FlgK [Deltaproteobacteria bacterium]
MGITSTLSIAAQAMKAQQLAIQTTGHNLANVATPGFSRQRVDLASAHPSFEGGVILGQGVEATSVQRIVDRFAEAELLSLNGTLGFSGAQSQALASIQEIFPTSGGIDSALSAFFSALSDLANNPAGLTERVSVIGKAGALGASLAQTRQSLTSVQQNLDEELRGSSTRVNLLAEQIAALNTQISTTETTGEPANDFRDQRQTLLQELTSLTGATVREDFDGQVNVIAGGLMLVGGARFASLQSDTLNANGLHTIIYRSPDGLNFDASAQFTAGKMGAILNMRDVTTQDLIDRLDQFAKTLIDEINAQHALGFDLTGGAGGEFFTSLATPAGAAANVHVAAAISADPRLIAAAAAAGAVPGDNRNAQALVGLQTTNFAALGGLTLQDSLLGLVGDVGAQAQKAQARLDFHQALLAQTQARRESASGVNIDEEMTKLIQFQRAFQASSMLVRTADDLYQSLLDMVR